jgi:thymidylate synthase (FAD)
MNVKLLSISGDIDTIVNAATVSTGKQIADKPAFIKSLIEREHWTPFEFVQLTFEVTCPIFVARQWMRSRTWSYVEKSRRYTKDSPEFYIPASMYEVEYQRLYYQCRLAYEYLLVHGETPEKARCVLPVATYTTFVATVNLRDLLHFLKLRTAKSAQYEIRQLAWDIVDILKRELPIVHEAVGFRHG